VDLWGSDTTFTKEDLRNRGTVEKVSALLSELKTFYIPCKARVYLVDIDEQKCITILRQIMRLHSVYLLSNQRMRCSIKAVHYVLVWPNKPQQLRKNETHTVLTFS
jgi:hypothetical protein